MATTSIKSIKGRIDHVISYVKNPEKTENKNFNETVCNYSDDEIQSLTDIMDYAVNDEKTEQRYFVSGIECKAETARDEMLCTMARHKIYRGNVVALHIYQSFKEGEVTPEEAHEIGKELARRFFNNEHQVVVATHLNTNHIHNHLVACPISFKTGKRFYNAGNTKYELRDCSDEICKEHGLSVIQNPPRASRKYYVEYMAEKNGDFTKNGIIKRDIDECVVATLTEQQFYREMAKRGYTFDFSHKYATISHPNFPKARRLKTLGEDYTPEAISERIYGHWKRERIEYPEQDDSENLFFGGDRNNPHIFDNYQTVYFHFIFGVGVIKERGDYNRELQRLLGEDLIKFDKRVEEQNLLLDNDLYTDEDILKFKTECQNEINELTEARKKLRNQLKCAVRADDISEQKEIKADISVMSQRIKKLRKNISVCDRLTENEPRIENNLHNIGELTDRQKGKEREDDECIKRRSRPNREDYS